MQESRVLNCLDAVARMAHSVLTFVSIITKRNAEIGQAASTYAASASAASFRVGSAYGTTAADASGGVQLASPGIVEMATPSDDGRVGSGVSSGGALLPGAESGAEEAAAFVPDEECIKMCEVLGRVGLQWLDALIAADKFRRPSVDRSRHGHIPVVCTRSIRPPH